VLPLLTGTVDRHGLETAGRDFVLPTLRGMALSWVGAAFPSRHSDIEAAYIDGATSYSFDANHAAVAASTEIPETAADAASSAVAAAATRALKTTGAETDIWAATSADARALEGRPPPKLAAADLANRALWETEIPAWAAANWRMLKKPLLQAHEKWEVWTAWYDERLRGSRRPHEALELARVRISQDIWMKGPRLVNATIKTLIDEHENKRRAPSVEHDAELKSLPPQGPGPQFRPNEDGLVDRAPPADIDAAGNDIRTINQLKPLVLRCANDLRARLSRNEFPELFDAVQLYRGAVDPDAGADVNWGEVWGVGVLLQNAAAAAKRKIESRTLPALEDPAQTALDSLLTVHGPMILATRDGAKLSETAANFSMTRVEQDSLRDATQQVAQRLTASPDVITPRAAMSVTDATGAIGQGQHPERGSVYGLATIKNVSIVLIGGAAAATPAIIGALLGQTVVGALIGAPLALVVVEAVKKNPAFAALVTQLGVTLDAMTDVELRTWLEERTRRFAPFRSFVIKNKEPLRQIANATPEMQWMLKYIEFIVGEENS
jgi:hypothetical protein